MIRRLFSWLLVTIGDYLCQDEDDMEPHYPDAPRIGDRVQIRPWVHRGGVLVGGVLADVVNVVVIDKPKGRRDVGVVIATAPGDHFLVALGEVTVLRREATA